MRTWAIIVDDLAQIDLREIYLYYENAKPGLGEEFLDALDITTEKIKHNPFHTSIDYEHCRSARLPRFPYEVLYLVVDETSSIVIIAIIHQHRAPEWINKRTENG